jgi:hypothetical protein
MGIVSLGYTVWQENLDYIFQALVTTPSYVAMLVKNSFFDKQDRSKFFFLLQEGIEKYRHRIYAYGLGKNKLSNPACLLSCLLCRGNS